MFVCDYCGEPIGDKLDVLIGGTMQMHAWGSGHEGDAGSSYEFRKHDYHYHATEEQPCWAAVLDRLTLVHSVEQGIAAGPVSPPGQ